MTKGKEGNSEQTTLRLPSALLRRVDAIAEQTEGPRDPRLASIEGSGPPLNRSDVLRIALERGLNILAERVAKDQKAEAQFVPQAAVTSSMKLPIRTYEVDHEVVTIDIFEDADGKPISAQDIVKAVNAQEPSDLETRLTVVVRQADLDFESVGGSSRHYVRECLLPALETAKLRVVDA